MRFVEVTSNTWINLETVDCIKVDVDKEKLIIWQNGEAQGADWDESDLVLSLEGWMDRLVALGQRR